MSHSSSFTLFFLQVAIKEYIGINFNLGFGSQPGNVIRNSVANATCLRSPLIAGSQAICPVSMADYKIEPLPQGTTITWSCSANLQIIFTRANGTEAVVWAKPNTYGSAWLKASILAGSQTYELNHEIWIGTPDVPVADYISGIAWVPNPVDGVTYRWDTSPAHVGISPMNPQNTEVIIHFPRPGGYMLFCWASNDCGERATPHYFYIQYNGNSHYSVYPVPVSDILNIDFSNNQLASDANKALEVGKINKTIKRQIHLYDKDILRKSISSTDEKVQMDVSDMPNGIYFLHIYSANNLEPETRTIIIQH